MADDAQRVPIWNALFELALAATTRCADYSRGVPSPPAIDLLGGSLPDDRRLAFGALALTALAIDARANHLVDWLVEADRIPQDVGEAVRWLPPKDKWFLLPELARISNASLDASAMPHRAVAQVLGLRDDVMHVRFDQIHRSCPTSEEMVRLFRNVVAALEDMNVVLGREDAARPEVLAFAHF